jgi:type 1 glutamine amidotransferase
MKKLTILAALCVAQLGLAADAPIKAMLISGGGYHDYKTQKTILMDGIKERAKNVEITLAAENPKQIKEVLSKPDWAKGYDVVIYNFCDAGQKDVDYIKNVIKTHEETGVGAVAIHCTMHSYHWSVEGGRKDFDKKSWVKFLGLGSRGHGPKKQITVTKTEKGKSNPIVEGIGDGWTTPQGELYYSDYVAPTTTVLANGTNDGGKKNEAVVWTNTAGKAKVFGTTIGHHNETMKAKTYLDMVTKGVQWAAGKSK